MIINCSTIHATEITFDKPLSILSYKCLSYVAMVPVDRYNRGKNRQRIVQGSVTAYKQWLTSYPQCLFYFIGTYSKCISLKI